MKVLALNSSPRIKGQSKTEIMLGHLVSGMEKAGAQVEVINLRTRDIRYCTGCFSCWTKTPGRCIQRDDMSNELLPRFQEADIAVFASPLYHFTLNALMKTFIERTLPLLEPTLVRKGDVTYHPLRGRHPGIVILSVAGFPELSVFDQLSNHMRFMYKQGLLGEIYRPGVEFMVQPMFREVCDEIYEAVSQAGQELVKTLKISGETLDRITRPVCDFNLMARASNIFWKTCISQGVTPEEMKAKKISPRPDSLENFMMLSRLNFKADMMPGREAIIQFHFSGDKAGACWFGIKDGAMNASAGIWPEPDLTIDAPFDLWMDIATGKADGQKMLEEGRFRVQGDLSLLEPLNMLKS